MNIVFNSAIPNEAKSFHNVYALGTFMNQYIHIIPIHKLGFHLDHRYRINQNNTTYALC